ncbi:MAG: Holliday junction branch migration protein RuvA, partial [Acidobacteria bacterium]|nr:Holliday junction branch migration protein RuvA [Acidobacteriota bacterium]
ELKDKVVSLVSPELEERLRAGIAVNAGEAMRDDVISALVNLEYPRAAAERAVINVLKENPDANFETTLKLALRKLAR